jgi:hypothetical protein
MSEPSDGHSYVNSIAGLTNINGEGNCAQHAQSSVTSNTRKSAQSDYVNQPVNTNSGGVGHHQNFSGQQVKDSKVYQKQHRRTQKRITHNEKRYHSGNKNPNRLFCWLRFTKK